MGQQQNTVKTVQESISKQKAGDSSTIDKQPSSPIYAGRHSSKKSK